MRISWLVATVLSLFGNTAWAGEQHRHPWSVTYKCGMQTAVIQESGATKLTRLSPGEWYKGKVGKSTGAIDKADAEHLFKLLVSPGFMSTQAEYLPKAGTFEAYGHSLITSITVVDRGGKPVKETTFSDKSEHPVPAVLKEISSAIAVPLTKKFGAPPPMLIN